MINDSIKSWLNKQNKTFVIEISFIVIANYLGKKEGLNANSIDEDVVNKMNKWLDVGKDDAFLAIGTAVCAKALIDFAFEHELCTNVINKRKAARQAALEEALAEDFEGGASVADSMRKSLENMPAKITRWSEARIAWEALKEKDISNETLIAATLNY